MSRAASELSQARGSIRLLECGQLLEPIFITFPIIGIMCKQFNREAELGTLQRFAAKHGIRGTLVLLEI